MKKIFLPLFFLSVITFFGTPVFAADPVGGCTVWKDDTHQSTACMPAITEAVCTKQANFLRWTPDEGGGSCTDFNIDDIIILEELLPVEVGTPPAEGQEGISVIKKGASKLNQMNISEPTELFSSAINLMLAFMGSIALVLYIFAGIMWMTAGGNDERVNKAKRIFVWTTLGALAMGASYMIIRTILLRVG